MIKVKDVKKSFFNDGTEISVLKDISFEIESGEVVSIMGPSGIGKSTLLNIMGTLEQPDGGEICYNNQEPFKLNEKEIARFRNTHIGFVFQFHHLLPEFTALENVLIPTLIYGNKFTPENEQRATDILERVGLGSRIHHRPAALSGGERQRVAVARALINNPLVVLADEPSGNLDVQNSAMLIELLLELNEKYRTTFIIATHNPDIAARSHKLLLLDNGRISTKQ